MQQFGSLDGNVAIVTGAAQGQGEAIARLLADRGAKVVLTDILEDLGRKTAQSIGNAAIFRKLDVADEAAWAALVADAEQVFGPVTILANNAGIFVAGALAEMSADDYLKVIRVNQIGPALGMRAVLPSMLKAGRGAIVNTSSLAGQFPIAYGAAYASSKAALSNLTRVAAREYAAHGIRVNSVAPGSIDTPMMAAVTPEERALYVKSLPLGRLGTSQDIASLVAFLVSDEASFMTGSEILIDGGQFACQ